MLPGILPSVRQTTSEQIKQKSLTEGICMRECIYRVYRCRSVLYSDSFPEDCQCSHETIKQNMKKSISRNVVITKRKVEDTL